MTVCFCHFGRSIEVSKYLTVPFLRNAETSHIEECRASGQQRAGKGTALLPNQFARSRKFSRMAAQSAFSLFRAASPRIAQAFALLPPVCRGAGATVQRVFCPPAAGKQPPAKHSRNNYCWPSHPIIPLSCSIPTTKSPLEGLNSPNNPSNELSSIFKYCGEFTSVWNLLRHNNRHTFRPRRRPGTNRVLGKLVNLPTQFACAAGTGINTTRGSTLAKNSNWMGNAVEPLA